jgi:MATE family multidrug resistance protein
MVRLGAPIGIQFGLEFGAFGAIGILMGWLGAIAMAGHQVAINLASLTFMVPLGISQASAVLVGQGVGRGDPPGARRAAGAGLVLGVSFMALTAILFRVFPEFFALIYTDETEVVTVAALLIPLAGLFQVFDGLQVVSSGVLRGVGDTRSPMIVNLLGFWCLGMPVSVLLGFWVPANMGTSWFGLQTPTGPEGLWWGLVVGLAAVAVFLLLRIRSHMGTDLKRIVIDDEE